MSQTVIDYRDCDRKIWEEELEDFVPRRILDTHIHCVWNADLVEVPAGFVQDDHNLATLRRRSRRSSVSTLRWTPNSRGV